MCALYRFPLPPFCALTPQDWQNLGHEYDEVRELMLGWDITDYGKGDFDLFSFSLITIRNGNRFNLSVGRFPEIEEDEPPYRLLCNEYPAAK